MELLQDENNPVWRWFPNNATMAQLADYLINSGVTVQEWVSIDDRLPKNWTDVLVSTRSGFLETAVYTGTPGKWMIGWNGDMLEADSITHWMPMPQPPKGE